MTDDSATLHGRPRREAEGDGEATVRRESDLAAFRQTEGVSARSAFGEDLALGLCCIRL